MAGTRRVDPIEVDTKEGGILKTKKGLGKMKLPNPFQVDDNRILILMIQ